VVEPASAGPRAPGETTLRDALALLIAEHADRLVVTDGDGSPVGSVTRDDILA
jgi:CBS domain-containing protein